MNKQAVLEALGVKFAALFTVVMGLINLLSAVQPPLHARFAALERIFPLEVLRGSRATSALAGFALLLLAGGLWRRKRAAWMLTIAVLSVSLVTHLLKGLDVEEASVALVLIMLLVALRYSFHAESDRPSVRQGVLVLAVALVISLAYGTLGFYLLDRHFSVRFGLAAALRETLTLFTAFYDPGLEPLTRFGRYFVDSIYIFGGGTLGFALLMLLRPVLVRVPAMPEERERARAIVERYGRTATARFALFDDKSYFFGPGDTLVAYAASGRGVMVLGDPIGPDESIAPTIRAFKAFCARNDWTPAYSSALPDYLDAYKAAGYQAVCIGYEAIVELKKFSLEGSANKGLRNTVSKMERLGFRAEVSQPPLSDELMRHLRQISDSWLTLHHGGEMRFSVGWFHDDYIRNGPVMVVYTPDGLPCAFTNLIPEYQKNELSIDLMRRYEKVEPGTMEFMFVKMMQWARAAGYDSFSLGVSAIVGVGEQTGDPVIEKALHTIASLVSRFYNFKGLHAFKEKFHPCWEPRYIVYPGSANLPLVLDTLLRVHSGPHYLWKFMVKSSDPGSQPTAR